MSKGYGPKDVRPERANVSLAAGATECIGTGHINDSEDAVRLRVGVTASAVTLGGGSIAGTLYHGPRRDGTLISTGKTINITAAGDYYFIVNTSDTGLVPLLPYIEVRVVSTGAAVATISVCDIYKVR